MKDVLWCEKYRPKLLEDMVMDAGNRAYFQRCVESKDLSQHLLLVGGPGSGKTTIARILIAQLDAESKELNASDERGIDTVRDVIKRFVSLDSGEKLRILFCDEADGLTSVAQTALRNLMEKFPKARFILSANYGNKIIEPIKSRCQEMHFSSLPAREQLKICKRVLDTEKITYDEEDVLQFIEACSDDMRRLINVLQRNSITGKLVWAEVNRGTDVAGLLRLVKEAKWIDLRKAIDLVGETEEVYEYLYNEVLRGINWEGALKIVAEYCYRDSLVYNRRINLMACLVELRQYILS